MFNFLNLGMLLCLGTLLNGVLGWGRQGHTHVALGMNILLPELHMDFVNDSLFPDEIRKKAGWRWTAPFHYINTDDDPPRSCPLVKSCAGPDILLGIARFNKQLRADPTDEFSLGMLIHLVQDLHQPLHVSGKGRGGNQVPIRLGKRTWKLHEVWDSVILTALYKQHGEKVILSATTKCSEQELCGITDVDAWARQSAHLVCSNAYVNMNATDDSYIKTNAPVVIEQLRLATCRCTALMRAVFNPRRCKQRLSSETESRYLVVQTS